TDPGERKTITFSNGSKITVNSSSVITYSTSRLHSQPIKVVLEGEAYFEANGNGPREVPIFAVHTPGGVIRDTGTKFLVKTTSNQSSVVLQEGKVEVSPSGQNSGHGKLSARQGQMLELNKSALLSKKTVNPTFYTSRSTGFMDFEPTNLTVVAGVGRARDDVAGQIGESGLSALTSDGAVCFKTLPEVVQSVSEGTKTSVYQSKDRQSIYIGHTKRLLRMGTAEKIMKH